MLAAGVVFLGTHVFDRGVPGFARVNVLIVLAAMGVARAAVARVPPPHRFRVRRGGASGRSPGAAGRGRRLVMFPKSTK